ncbi:hypothetical protein KEM52_005388 [Ascosphaera acerosa]|nr:hypothetical protein KEM52_005388 [Ascosphaera acerosa]
MQPDETAVDTPLQTRDHPPVTVDIRSATPSRREDSGDELPDDQPDARPRPPPITIIPVHTPPIPDPQSLTAPAGQPAQSRHSLAASSSPTTASRTSSTDREALSAGARNRNRPADHDRNHRSSYDRGRGGASIPMIELRRKDHSVQDSSAAQATRLMDRPSFSLDHAPAITTGSRPSTAGSLQLGAASLLETDDFVDIPQTPAATNTSFHDLPAQDKRSFLMLVMLYFLQGIPMGLASGSVPFLLKPYLSYGQIGIFSLASYPYSLKLLWSPIVDAVWSRDFGRRKSWITPIQFISGLSMIYLGSHIEKMMTAAGANDGAGVWGFTGWWFLLVFLCATQDIAVDGWAISLLSASNVAYASTAQTVGLTAGQFLSYTVFLAFNSPDFANKWFRSVPKDEGLLSLGGYLRFWGWMYLIITVGLAVLKKEERSKDKEGIVSVYKTMWGVLQLKNVQTLIVVHLIAKIGFIANDAVTNLKLLDKGFGQENLALVVLIDFPFEIALGYYAGKWSTQYGPMRLWCWAFVGRIGAALFAHLTIVIYPVAAATPPASFMLLVILEHIMSTFMSTVMFVAISAYHARIADPVIGGTYMTLLATVSNLGGTFPRFFVLMLVDLFTDAVCYPPSDPASAPASKPGASPLPSDPFSCSLEAEKHRCIEGGGTCQVNRDGYYVANILCVIFGLVTFVWYIKPEVMKLQRLPLRAWRVVEGRL